MDLILTQQMDDKDTPLAKRFVSETVLSDVRVVAVDQSIAQGAVAAGDNTTGRLARTVTLEVTPQQAERAALADRLGKITLAICAADAVADATGPRGLSLWRRHLARTRRWQRVQLSAHADHRRQGCSRGAVPVTRNLQKFMSQAANVTSGM